MMRALLPSARLLAALVLLLGLFAGCKGTEDHLAEIEPGRAIDKRGQLNPLVYDAGQLVHESLVGLQQAEALTSSQVLRGAWRAAAIAADNSVPLLRAQAVDFLVHLVRHLPLPPRTEPYDPELEARDSADILTRLYEAVSPLEVAAYVQALDSPDPTEVERAFDALAETTGEDFGRDAVAWQTWWEGRRPEVTAEVDAQADGILRELAGVRMEAIRSTYLVLQALTVVDLYRPALEDARWTMIHSFVRQVAVLAVIEALGDEESPLVRAAGLRGARQLLVPAFEEPLLALIQRESDLHVFTRAFELLAFYPSARAVQILVRGTGSDRAHVAAAARASLVAISGQDRGDDPRAWAEWLQREAGTRWQ